MPSGGRREGAGRKPGAAWCKSSALPMRTAARAALAQIMADGNDPLTLLVAISRDEGLDLALRVEAASRALPYIHPRLVSTNPNRITGDVTAPVRVAAAQEGDRRGASPAPQLEDQAA